MNPQERLNLKKMLSQSNEYIDHTDDIRRVKHSGLLLDSLRDIEKLKRQNRDLMKESPEEFRIMCETAAPLMYNLYTDLFNKLVKDELNLVILVKLIRVLEMIETEQIDQNEGSVMVGKILKELYVDSAVRSADNLDKAREADAEAPVPKQPAKAVSWRQWKASNDECTGI